MKILVTGGAGYIGSHFIKRALNRYPTVELLALDDLREGHEEAIKSMTSKTEASSLRLINCSLADYEGLSRLFSTETPDAVVHFAAHAYVGESQQKPFKYFDNNVVGSLNLFKAMNENGVKKVIFSSSCTTYGNPEYVPIDEKHPQKPINVYGATKMMIEQALKALSLSSGWSFVSLRYFNAAGADDEGMIGESHDPETHLIPLVLQTALGKRKQLSIFGDDYDTEDGTCIRDYVHVNDLADAHCMALDKILQESLAEVVNLGTSHGASVMEVIKTCEKITGLPVAYEIAPRRAGDPARLVADYSKAKELLGWEPKYNLEKVITTAWNWEKRRSY